MQKYPFLLVLLCSAWMGAQAQIATISDPVNIRQEDRFEVVGKVGSSLFMAKDQTEGGKLMSFDKYMKLRWTLDIAAEKKRYDIVGSIARPDYFGLVIRFRKKGGTLIQFQKYDEAGELVDSTIIKDYGRRAFSPDTRLSVSADQQKITIWHDAEEDLLEATGFDIQRMEVMWDKPIRTGRLSTRKDLYQVLTDNQGHFYSVFNKDNTRAQKDRARLIILQCGRAGKETFNVHLESNLVYDSYFTFDNKNQQIVGGGLYDDRKPSRAKGYFYLRCPIASPGKHLLTFQPFTGEFMSSIVGKEVDDKHTFGEAYVNDLVLRSDGGIIIVSERYRKLNQVYDPTFPRAGTPRVGTQAGNQAEYHYDDIILLSVNPDGSPDWQDVLYKRQYSRDDGGDLSSFFIMKSPSFLRFIYNDEIKPDNAISEYVLLRSGNNQRNSVLDTDGYNVRLMFRNSLQLSAREIIVPSVRKRVLKLVRIRYE